MLLRMYLRYGEKKGLHGRSAWKNPKVKWPASRAPPSSSPATIPTATLRTETGIHRLVRKSPV
jgi:protein subunit release factor B